jgi:hypothetical protein
MLKEFTLIAISNSVLNTDHKGIQISLNIQLIILILPAEF